MLFSLYTQSLLAFMQAERSEGRMLGVKLVESISICERLFADDLEILIPALEQAFQELEQTISTYEQASGAKLYI